MSQTRGADVTYIDDIVPMRDEHYGTVSFEWSPDAAGGWTLHGASGVEGRLSRADRAWVAEAGGEAWTLQRVGFNRPRIVVRPAGQLAEIAHAQADWRGLQALHFVSGPTWEIDPTHSGGTVVRDEARAVVLRVTWNGRFDQPGARVQADAARWPGRFGVLAGVVAGFGVLEGIEDPNRRLAFGVPIGATVRTRIH